ncbi:MAG: hypothetical protein MI746_16235 [Pseudomonadales bacterium]|nr:hypothetical protein [Pseudomonadales bacterium]
MGQYRPMFNISMEHTYFSSGKLSGVNFLPTARTQKLMHNVNLVSRERPDGLTMFFDGEHLEALKLHTQDQDDPLRVEFKCEVEHENFQNFTASSAYEPNKTLYFDSENTDSQPLGGKKYLHTEEFVSSSELIDNPTLAPVNGNLTDRRNPSLGMVSIQVSDQELEELASDSNQLFNDYTIRFKARETYWKYFLIGEANREGAYIRDVNGEMEFEDLGEEQVADGRMARVFITTQAIPMQDRAKPKFQLVITKNNRPKVLVSRLAVATAKRINKVNHQDRELFVSEIYVNF